MRFVDIDRLVSKEAVNALLGKACHDGTLVHTILGILVVRSIQRFPSESTKLGRKQSILATAEGNRMMWSYHEPRPTFLIGRVGSEDRMDHQHK
jgi:hypothetical protein